MKRTTWPQNRIPMSILPTKSLWWSRQMPITSPAVMTFYHFYRPSSIRRQRVKVRLPLSTLQMPIRRQRMEVRLPLSTTPTYALCYRKDYRPSLVEDPKMPITDYREMPHPLVRIQALIETISQEYYHSCCKRMSFGMGRVVPGFRKRDCNCIFRIGK